MKKPFPLLMRSSSHLRRGFTLVELLAALAIVGVLAGFIVAAVVRTRASAAQAVCTAHLHQLGVGFRLYASDHRGALPPLVDTAQNPSQDWTKTGWFPQLMQAYVDAPDVWDCPAQPSERAFGRNGAWRAGKNWYIPSYAINSMMAGRRIADVVDGVANGNNQILLTEGQSNFWDSGSISAAQNYVQTPHEGAHTNTFLFADGRVEPGAKADMVAYTQGGGSSYRIITLQKYKH